MKTDKAAVGSKQHLKLCKRAERVLIGDGQLNDLATPEQDQQLIRELCRHNDVLLERNEQLEQTVEQSTASPSIFGKSMLMQVLDRVPVMAAAISREGVVSCWNRECERVSGYSCEEIVGAPDAVEKLYSDPAVSGKIRSKFLAGDVGFSEWEMELVCRDGSRKIISWSGVAHEFEPAEWDYWAVGADITESRRTEHKLRLEIDRARTYFDAARTLFVVVNADHTVAAINEAGREALGCEEGAILGHDWFKRFVPPADRAEGLSVFGGILSGNTESNGRFESRIVTDSGEERDIAWQHSVLRADDGQITGMLSSGEDITERKKARQALLSSEERYRSLQDNLPLGIFRSTPEGRIITANPAMLEMFQFESEEEMMSVPAVDHYCDPTARDLMLKRLSEEGAVTNFECECRRKDGTTFWLSSSLRATFDQNGNVLYFDGIDRDITERKRAEEALRRSQEYLRRQFQAIPVPTFTWTKEGEDFVLSDFNTAADQFTGGEVVRYLKSPLSKAFADTPWLLDDVWNCLNGQDDLRREVYCDFLHAGEKHLEVTYAIIPPETVMVHTRDITERVEAAEALTSKNIALREVLSQVEAESENVQNAIKTNMEKAVAPKLRALLRTVQPPESYLLEQLDQNLKNLVSPLMSRLETEFASLTPREMEIAGMIRNGMSSKEIAAALHLSVETVHKFRHHIRKKLGLTNEDVNLTSYLRFLDQKRISG